MNAEIKRQWVAALRSGEYVQGRGVLRTSEDAYCCLGVLCDLAAKVGVTAWSRLFNYSTWEAGQCSSAPPIAVSEWAELDGRMFDDVNTDLMSMNDGGFDYAVPLSFAQIADVIEARF